MAVPVKYRLRPAARLDLEDIWRHGLHAWGEEAADRYYERLLVAFSQVAHAPLLHRSRDELGWPVRLARQGVHVIAYFEGPPVEIVRILHERQDYVAALSDTSP